MNIELLKIESIKNNFKRWNEIGKGDQPINEELLIEYNLLLPIANKVFGIEFPLVESVEKLELIRTTSKYYIEKLNMQDDYDKLQQL